MWKFQNLQNHHGLTGRQLVVAWELSAAETENGADLPKDEIWYFGFPKNKVLFCAKLLDENAELEFETIMRTLKY